MRMRELLLASSMFVAGLAVPAYAQEAAEADGATENDGTIVVTASKRSTALQETPAAISVIGGESLERQGVTNLIQLQSVIPGARIIPLKTQAMVTLRGAGQTLTSPNGEQAVAFNVNGVGIPQQITGLAFFDVDRIEVLPGPQGTLYGNNATGGVINVITRQPTFSPSVEGFVEVGNYDRVQGFVGADVPLSETVALRAAASIIEHDGYFSNGLANQDTVSARLTALWEPSSSTRIVAAAAYIQDNSIDALQNIPWEGDPWFIDSDLREQGYYADGAGVQASLDVSQELSPNLTLNYVGGYNFYDGYIFGELWAGPPARWVISDWREESQSHEVRLNGEWDNFNALGGVYFFVSNAGYQAFGQITDTLLSSSGPLESDRDGFGVFAQGTYSVTDALRLTGGLRYSRVSSKIDGTNTLTSNDVPTVTAYQGDRTEDRLDWKVGVEADAADDVMLYASVATGFTPGGFSTANIGGGSTQAPDFQSMKLTAYTGGLKSQFLDRLVTVNLEGFYYDYKDFQVSARNPLTGQNNVYNAEKSRIYGAQLDTAFALGDNTSLSLGYVYLDAKAVRLQVNANNYDGFELPHSPKHTITANFTQSFDLSTGAEVEFVASSQYSSDRWGNYSHTPGSDIPGTTRTNLSLTYRAANGRWDIGAWVRNVENSITRLIVLAGAIPGPAAASFDAPRTFGGRFGFNF